MDNDLLIEIAFRGMDPSPAVEARIREKIAWLRQYYSRITSVRVVVEAPHRHHHKGRIYHVKIEVGLPGRRDIVVGREPESDHAHEDVYVSIRDAFDAARRRLQDVVAKMDAKERAQRR